MKSWIKRSLLVLAGTTVMLGGLTACGGRGYHAQGMSDERITEMRGKAIERISGKLELNVEQRAKLDRLADEMIASRKALRGDTSNPRADLKALIAGEKFDKAKAQQLLDQKTLVVQGNGPKMLSAFGDFYDSLNPDQQQRLRERLERRGHGWWRRG